MTARARLRETAIAPRGVAIGLALSVFGFWLPLAALIWWWLV